MCIVIFIYITYVEFPCWMFRAVHNKLEQSMRLSTIRDYPSFYQLLIQTRWAQIRQLNVIKRGRNCGRKQIPSHKDKTTSMAVAVTAVATVAESLMWRNEILVATHRSVAVNRRDNVRDLKPITPTRDGFHSPCKTLYYRYHYFHNLSHLGSFPLLPARRTSKLHEYDRTRRKMVRSGRCRISAYCH